MVSIAPADGGELVVDVGGGQANPGVEIAGGDGPGGLLHGQQRPGEASHQPEGDGDGGQRRHHGGDDQNPAQAADGEDTDAAGGDHHHPSLGGRRERLGDPHDLTPATRLDASGCQGRPVELGRSDAGG